MGEVPHIHTILECSEHFFFRFFWMRKSDDIVNRSFYLFFVFFVFVFLYFCGEERGKAKKGVSWGSFDCEKEERKAREGNVQWPAPFKACPVFFVLFGRGGGGGGRLKLTLLYFLVS